jgi:thymidylate synthase (FAD)
VVDNVTVLDHGYVRLIETWGSDERIVEAARMSTDKGFQGWGGVEQCDCVPPGPALPLSQVADPNCKRCEGSGLILGDEKLLRFLYRHDHATPFEMAGMVIEVQAPIFVFREWHRHRTQSYNELSARYTSLPDMYYVPSIERLMAARRSKINKQSSEQGFTEAQAHTYQLILRSTYQNTRNAYETLLSEGVAPEVARLVIPVAQYSRMRASANLRNWLAFLTLRMAPNAQWEIRQYANIVAGFINQRFARTYDLFAERRNAA